MSHQVYDIDRCLLLEARGHGGSDPRARDRHCAAARHENLLALADDGAVSGVRAASEREREADRRDPSRRDPRGHLRTQVRFERDRLLERPEAVAA
ncbi:MULTISPECIES: hypothetical protein [unclassified Streptomyces]|uniref:hypothetical protein n=1 Tax=unclassified Streptomyces TaxID=2593676 RepID=UPI0036F63295